MARRLELHEKLCKLLGTRYVYFQPPESVKLHYDAIIYKEEPPRRRHADDMKYFVRNRYTVTLLTKDPDNPLIHDLPSAFLHCSMDQSYVSDNIYHYVYTLYY